MHCLLKYPKPNAWPSWWLCITPFTGTLAFTGCVGIYVHRGGVAKDGNCTFSCLTELIPTEAASAVIAGHCLQVIVARYGCFQYLRSDRGTRFVNDVITEFLRLFEMQRILTLPDRLQANSMIERNGGEVQRHLRDIVFDKRIRPIWSVVLPLVQRVLNHTFRQRIGTVPNRLLYICLPDLDRGLFEPFRASTMIPLLCSDPMLANWRKLTKFYRI